MLRFAADENFNNDVVRGLLRQRPGFDLIRIQEAGLCGVEDPEVLAWASEQGRVLLSHDVNTMTEFASARVRQGLRMPGLILAGREVPMRAAIQDILLLAECARPEELEGQIIFLPLR
jgi:Domain of unknown function (DUF5615)